MKLNVALLHNALATLIIADVGSADHLQALGVHHQRIPDWVLPYNMIALHNADPHTARDKIRPDTMVVELTQTEQQDYLRNNDKVKQTLPTSVGTKKIKVWILEGDYCSDTNYEHKFKEKTGQQQVLVNMLTNFWLSSHTETLAFRICRLNISNKLRSIARCGHHKTPSTTGTPRAAPTCYQVPS